MKDPNAPSYVAIHLTVSIYCDDEGNLLINLRIDLQIFAVFGWRHRFGDGSLLTMQKFLRFTASRRRRRVSKTRTPKACC